MEIRGQTKVHGPERMQIFVVQRPWIVFVRPESEPKDEEFFVESVGK